jgi:hypothetical protein
MSEQYGNLALNQKPDRRLQEPLQRVPAPRKQARPPIETVRIGTEPVKPAVDLTYERARQIRRELTASRIRSLLLILMTVMMVSGIFGLMVYRQSQILSENFTNLAITRQISKYNEESGQISEKLAVRTELDQIRTQAIQRLGLQVPARNQLVTVVIPNTDRVVFNDTKRQDPDTEQYLSSLLFNLEGFFKTIDVKGRD